MGLELLMKSLGITPDVMGQIQKVIADAAQAVKDIATRQTTDGRLLRDMNDNLQEIRGGIMRIEQHTSMLLDEAGGTAAVPASTYTPDKFDPALKPVPVGNATMGE